MTFRGWPPEALTFYEGLQADNTRTYWQDHKDVYESCVREPFEALSDAVADEFGALHLFRPYRDVRFSKDKSPYKTEAGAVTEGDVGVYYVQVSADGLLVGAGTYALARDQLERYRASVADDTTGTHLASIVDDLRRQGLELMAFDALKSAPRGYPRDHARIELLRLKGVASSRRFGAPAWLHTRKALDHIRRAWRASAPLIEWLDTRVGPSTLPPERR